MSAQLKNILLIPQPAPHGDGITDLGIVRMTVAEFATIPDNPEQRDTVKRASRAKHLMVPHATHSKVNIAVLPNGYRCVVDGHTRRYLWVNGMVAAPPHLDAQMWGCTSVEIACRLYRTFDSSDAVEKTADRMFGAIKKVGASFTSELLSSQRFTNGLLLADSTLLRISMSPQRIKDAVALWLPELILLDQCEPTRLRFIAGVVAGALLTLRRYGADAVPFWLAYSKNLGSKIDGEMDPVQALDERVTAFCRNGRTSGRANQMKLMCCVISAYERHRRGENYSRDSTGIKSISGSNLESWIRAAASRT